MDYYVLYCCKRCHGQFREKDDLEEHQRDCPALKGFKNTEPSAKEQHIDQSSENDSPRKFEETASETKQNATKKNRNPKRKSRRPSLAVSTGELKSCISSKPKHSPKETADVDNQGKRGRSQRAIKPTTKFKEYLLDQKSQSENILIKERKACRRGANLESVKANKEKEHKSDFNYKKTICSIAKNVNPAHSQDKDRTHVTCVDSNLKRKIHRTPEISKIDNVTTSIAISKTKFSDEAETQQDLQEIQLNTRQEIKKEIREGFVATSVLESTESKNKHSDGNKHVFEEIIESNMGQHEKQKRGRKRTASYKEVKLGIKSKKLSNVAVTLQEYPESYCIEEYVSSDPLDKGKSASEKLCQRYLCKLCNAYRTVSKDQMEKHIALHVHQKLTCQHCKNVFNSLHNLYAHVRQEHQLGILCVCEHCGEDFSEKRLYKKHLSKVHEEAAFKCPRCDKRFLSNNEYKQHRLNDHENLAFKCEKCDGIFLTEKLLENHKINNVCEVKSFRCQFCPSKKKSQALLDEHVRKVHSKEHRYKCNLCTYSTGMNYMLKHHMRAHLGIHPHKCDQCKFTCVKKWQLVSHMRTHSGEKKYKCDKCSYSAGWNVQVKTHMKAHGSDTQQICKICNIVFKDMRCFNIHNHKEHLELLKSGSGARVNRAIHKPLNMVLRNNKTPLQLQNSRCSATTSHKPQNMVFVEGTNLVVYKGSGPNPDSDLFNDSFFFTDASKTEVVRNKSYNSIGAKSSVEASLTTHDTGFCETLAGTTPASQPHTEKMEDSATNSKDPLSVRKSPADIQQRHPTPAKVAKSAENTACAETGLDSGHMHLITKTGKHFDDVSRISDSKAYCSENKNANISMSAINDKTPCAQKKDVTYIRLYINPDGSRRFEAVNPKTKSLSKASEPVNIASERITSCPLPGASVSAQSAHSYAMPVHKRKMSLDSYTAFNCVHSSGNVFSTRTDSPALFQNREKQNTMTNMMENDTVKVPSNAASRLSENAEATSTALTDNIPTSVFTDNTERVAISTDAVTATVCVDVVSIATASKDNFTVAVCNDKIDGTVAALSDGIYVSASADKTDAAVLTEHIATQFENKYNHDNTSIENMVSVGTNIPETVFEVIAKKETQ